MKQNEQQIKELLHQPDLFRLDLHEETDSTNLLCRQMGTKGELEGYVAIADAQTAGRGRLGRSFQSPSGTGLYMSLLLRPKMPAAEALRITTAAAVAVAEAVTAVCGRTARIKWVNDIYLGERKVCGILTESVLSEEPGRLSFAVLGIGVNLTEPEGGFDESIAGIAGALFERNAVPEHARERLAAEILNQFYDMYQNLTDPGILARYREYSLLLGRTVEVYPALAEKKDGRIAEVLSVSDDFGLRVRFQDGTCETLSTGEVSLRLKE